jgi:hypothetical protein
VVVGNDIAVAMVTAGMNDKQRSKRITVAKAARLIAAMEAIRECDDVPDALILAFDDVRAAISPFYDID